MSICLQGALVADSPTHLQASQRQQPPQDTTHTLHTAACRKLIAQQQQQLACGQQQTQGQHAFFKTSADFAIVHTMLVEAS
jgi:hypothetical protein